MNEVALSVEDAIKSARPDVWEIRPFGMLTGLVIEFHEDVANYDARNTWEVEIKIRNQDGVGVVPARVIAQLKPVA